MDPETGLVIDETFTSVNGYNIIFQKRVGKMKDFKEIIQNFFEQTDSLCGYFSSYDTFVNDVTESFGKNSTEKLIKEGMLQLMGMVTEYKSNPERFITKLKELNDVEDIFPKEIIENPDQIFNFLAKKYSNENIQFEFVDDKGVTVKIKDFKTSTEFKRGLLALTRISQQQLFFNHTALLALTNTFEYFVAQILRDAVIRNFDKPSKDKRAISFDELLLFSSFDEAKEYFINETINQQLREPKKETIQRICSYISKDIFKERFLNDAEIINEIFQRRNIVVHNKAIVNDQYLNTVVASLREGIQKGSEIAVDKKYLHSCLESVVVFYSRLFYKYWLHVDRDKEANYARFHTYHLFAFNKLTESNFRMAEEIFDILREDINNIPADLKLLLEINYCQTLKWQGKEEQFRKAFKKIDFSLAHNQHLMCKFLLVDDFPNAAVCFGKVLDDKSNEVTHPEMNDINYYIEWPIFRNFRDSDEFKALLDERNYEGINIGDYS